MKIFVCIRQVPDTDSKIKLAGDPPQVDFSGLKWIVNPYDLFAIEEAVKLKEAHPQAQVHLITLGPKPRSTEALVTGLAMGADEALLIHSSPQSLDSLATAKALSKVIQDEGGASLVFTGRSSIDMNQSATPQMLAEFLNYSHCTVVSKFSFSNDHILVDRDIDGGAKEVLQVKAPVVIAANKGLNSPRYPSLPGIMKAKKKTIKEIDFNSLGIASDFSKVNFGQFKMPPDRAPVKLISGDVPSQVSTLAKLLRDEAKVL